MAYKVQSSEEVDQLQAYEMENYVRRGCNSQFDDGRKVSGTVLEWNNDKSLLQEGIFDLEEWLFFSTVSVSVAAMTNYSKLTFVALCRGISDLAKGSARLFKSLGDTIISTVQ